MGKNNPPKKKKGKNVLFLSAGCFLLRAEGFLCFSSTSFMKA
jgi:hypothetical protein